MLNINTISSNLNCMINYDQKFIVLDEFGDSLRAFSNKESAKAFTKLRPECKIIEIPDITHEEFTKIYGEPPF